MLPPASMMLALLSFVSIVEGDGVDVMDFEIQADENVFNKVNVPPNTATRIAEIMAGFFQTDCFLFLFNMIA